MKKNTDRTISDYLITYLGCIIQAFAVTSILKPNGLIVGGFTGLSIVLGKIIHIKYTYIYYSLCLLVLISAWIILGKKEAFEIILLSLTYPIILILFDNLNFTFINVNSSEKLLACIYYGVITGIGVGLILKTGFSQGSSDTVAKMLHKKFFPFISISYILLTIDICILITSAFIFGKTAVLYAIIMQVIYAKTVDIVLSGFGSSLVKIIIITDTSDEILNYILNTLNKDSSISTIKGANSNISKTKIVCICSIKESILIKDFVSTAKVTAFINVVPVINAWIKNKEFEDLKAI